MPGLQGITQHSVGDVTVLELEGRLVLEEGEIPLREQVDQLVAQGPVKIVLDMSHVTRLDSAGIGTLVSKYLTASRKGGNLKLVQPTDHSRYLLDITKLSTVFEIYESEEEAIRSFARERG